jgi:hypothetical protein
LLAWALQQSKEKARSGATEAGLPIAGIPLASVVPLTLDSGIFACTGGETIINNPLLDWRGHDAATKRPRIAARPLLS